MNSPIAGFFTRKFACLTVQEIPVWSSSLDSWEATVTAILSIRIQKLCASVGLLIMLALSASLLPSEAHAQSSWCTPIAGGGGACGYATPLAACKRQFDDFAVPYGSHAFYGYT